jgi:hypothetical protein
MTSSKTLSWLASNGTRRSLGHDSLYTRRKKVLLRPRRRAKRTKVKTTRSIYELEGGIVFDGAIAICGSIAKEYTPVLYWQSIACAALMICVET